MAVSQGSKALYSDLKGYYTSFNSFISAYGGSITQLTVPTANKRIDATDITNLNSKVDAFKSDEYLKTQASWWVKGDATVGDLIQPADVTGINTTITNMAKVKCRNKATNNYSNNGECCNSNNKSVCCNSNNKSVCCNSNNKSVCCNSNNKSVCCNSNNKSVCCNSNNKSVCCNSNNKTVCCNSNNQTVCCNSNSRTVCCQNNSNHGQTCSNGVYGGMACAVRRFGSCTVAGNYVGNTALLMKASNGGCARVIDGMYACSVTCSAFSPRMVSGWGVGDCSVTCGYSTNGNACANSNHGQTCANSNHGQTCANSNHGQSCNNGTHNQSCNNGTHNQTCGNSTHNQTCNNGTHNQTCNNSTHNQTCGNSTHNQTCNNSTNARTCSNTSTIDITCQQATKTKT